MSQIIPCKYKSPSGSNIEPWIEGIFYGFFQESSKYGNTLTCAIVSKAGYESSPFKLWNWEGHLILNTEIESDVQLS